MIEISDVVFKANATRVGFLKVKYYDLIIKCDICLYKNEKLWIRMPETWVQDKKKNYAYWESKEKSNINQEIILKKLSDLMGFSLEIAIELKRKWLASKKSADNNKENI